MGKIIVSQSEPLKGTVRISGSKNSVLPIIAATLLTKEQCIVENIPNLRDVKIMLNILESIGAKVEYSNSFGKVRINNDGIDSKDAPYGLVNKLRASFLIMGPLLAKRKEVRVPLPGGCAIGSRPVDLHLKGFVAMGATVTMEYGYIKAEIKDRLVGASIYLDFPSVGATENIMMAATLAKGETIIENSAVEPEIVDLANYLISLGASIKGAGTDTIKIMGVDKLHGSNYSAISDRIEAGTFMMAAYVTKGEVLIENIIPEHLRPIIAKLKESGAEIIEGENSLLVKSTGKVKAIDVKTHPHPGFPTDMQAQMMSLLTIAEGTSMIVETIFENRFMHVDELIKMGANIKAEGRSAIIEGQNNLTGANVKATDLRAGAALVIAGLVAEGETHIADIFHIERGYDNLVEKMSSLGANIRKEL